MPGARSTRSYVQIARPGKISGPRPVVSRNPDGRHGAGAAAPRRCAAPGPITIFLFLRYSLQSFKVDAEVPNQGRNDVRHLIFL
jgi:hypothetical protein